ncbi:hypothetical protein EKO27_g3902 [Xylaria grammica]|uniref:Protein kinase domain-containing protein n=1 Tax=Xylaria grammica TaxID=363999 RepID=A0A439D9X9_9PEZI|nr:hypothetical protein EKO27_g3902 [Xylaria grammica]
MDGGPGTRARLLTRFFGRLHGYHPEKYIGATIIYKRTKPDGDVERIVVKHAQFRQDGDEIQSEEKVLRSLWGSEHNLRLIAITDDRKHRQSRWDRPRHRTQDRRTLPWKLPVNQLAFKSIKKFRFFVTEYLSRGDGLELIARCQEKEIKISEPILWCFWLCLTRACIGVAYPPSRKNRHPPEVWRETLPITTGQRRSKITHGDIYLGNIMFGDYNSGNGGAQPACHHITPILKKHCKKICFGSHLEKVMQQLAKVERNEVLVYPDDRSALVIEVELDERGLFETMAEEEFSQSDDFSVEFRCTIARCMATEPANRPTFEELLAICERNIALTQDWTPFRVEVNELFETPAG